VVRRICFGFSGKDCCGALRLLDGSHVILTCLSSPSVD
jgi:hypothetical protein